MTYNELQFTMKDDKKKTFPIENRDFANDLARVANDAQVPPLYHTTEIDGIIVKQYPFIRGNSAIYNRKDPFPKLDIDTDSLTDYTLLSARKNEIENQIELHRKYCIGQYNHIKLATRNWLNDKVGYCPDDVIGDSDRQRLTRFIAQIYWMQSWIMLGVEMDVIRKDLKKQSYSPTLQIDPVKWPTMSFEIDELIEKIKSPVAAIERIVSRTVTLYFEYVNIQSILYELDLESLFETLNSENNIPYGVHQANEDWVIETWNNVRGKVDSNNKADIEVERLYKEKYNGLTISKRHIQRFTGR